jgi:predicted enzyme related to lactoylglutathione lyase
MGDYYIAMVDDHQACGLMGQGPEMAGAPPMWTVFIYVDDLDATAGRVVEAGGTVLTPPFDIPDARIAVIADPGGAVFGLYGGSQIEGEFYSEDVGRVCWAELKARDPEAVQGFYRDLLGWEAATELAAGNPIRPSS